MAHHGARQIHRHFRHVLEGQQAWYLELQYVSSFTTGNDGFYRHGAIY